MGVEHAAAPAVGAPLRLLVADDQPIIRRGLALMLDAEPDIEVVGQAADGQRRWSWRTPCTPTWW